MSYTRHEIDRALQQVSGVLNMQRERINELEARIAQLEAQDDKPKRKRRTKAEMPAQAGQGVIHYG